MTDDLPQLVQRLRYQQRLIAAGEAGMAVSYGDIMDTYRDTLAALDSLTRALAEQQEAHRREGNEWIEAMFNTTAEMERLQAAAREARAETWASAIGAVEALGESGFFNYAKEKLKAARAGQP